MIDYSPGAVPETTIEQASLRSTIMADENDAPKIHIDSDWKEEAEREKQRLAEEEAQHQQRGPIDRPTFMHLINMLAMQATVALGGMRGPQGETIEPDPELARFHIDMLGLLEEKTKGNLDDEESKTLVAVVRELRSMYVQLAQMMAQAPKE